MKVNKMKVRNNDVYKLDRMYNHPTIKSDNTFIYVDGLFYDTYTAYIEKGDPPKFDPETSHEKDRYTYEELSSLGKLKFYCNLSETKTCYEDTFEDYELGDKFDLSRRGGEFPHYAIKKGATPSNRVMIANELKKIEQEEYVLSRAAANIRRAKARLEELKEEPKY